MSIQRLGLVSAVAFLAGLLAACSLSPDARTPAEPRTPARSTVRPVAAPGDAALSGAVKADEFNDQATGREAPVKGGQIVVRFNAEPQTLNTWLSTADAYSQYMSDYMHDYLLRQNPETFQFEASLAERWVQEDVVLRKGGSRLRGTVIAGGANGGSDVTLRTSAGDTLRLPGSQVEEVRMGVAFTFFLRRGVKFHDGKPMTAADVKFSLDTIKNEHVDAPDLRVYFHDVESYEVLDPFTIRIIYGKQYWQAINVIGQFEILPKHVYDPDNLQERDPQAFGKQFNESQNNRAPVGAGPYRFVRWDTGQQVVLERFEGYWDERRPGYLDRILFRFISDPVAALQSLKNGEVQFIAGRQCA